MAVHEHGRLAPDAVRDGFRVLPIERCIDMGAGSIMPDVVSVSGSLLHALIVDCSSGKSINLSQDARYAVTRRVDLANSAAVKEETADSRRLLRGKRREPWQAARHTKSPFMVFVAEFVKGVGSFEQPRLDKALRKGASLRGLREPLYLHPFSLDYPSSAAPRFIISGIVSCVAKSGPKSVALLLRKA